MPQILPIIAYAAATEAQLAPLEIAAITLATAVAVSVYEKQQADAQARASALASLQDRLINVRSGIAPRQYVFGHCRTGGALLYIETTGTKKEALDSVTAYASNVCEITDWFLGDDQISAGAFPGSKYGRETNIPTSDLFTVSGPTATVSATSRIAASTLHATWRQSGNVGTATAINTTGLSVSLSGLPSGSSQVTLSYQTPQDAFLRGQFKSGTADQVVTDWSGYSTPEWDSNHRLRGVAHGRTLNVWDANTYQNGAPGVTVALIGEAIDGIPFFDPRDNSHPINTSNPALIAAYWMTLPRSLGGMGIPVDWVDFTTVAAAATICDELITVKTLDGTSFEQIVRYSCDTVLTTDVSPLDNFKTILSAMAGEYAFTCGKYRIFAGAFRPATITITDNDVVGTKSITVNTATTTDTPPNIVTATFADAAQAWESSSPTAVQNDTYIADDGAEEPLDLQLKATTDARRAGYLMGVKLEQGRPSYGVSMSIAGIGEDIGLYDTVQLNLVNRPNYAGRTFEVASIIDNWDGTFDVQLIEIKPTTFALDPETFTPITPVVPPDNSYLWSPPQPTSFVVTAITPTTLPDGTAISRVSLAWDPIPPLGNTPGAYFNIRYRTTGGSWIGAAPIPGDATSTTLTTALEDGEMYQFEIQFVNGIGAASDWTDAYTGIDGTPLPTPLSLRLAASSLIFRVPETGNALPVSITLSAIRSGGLMGTAVFTTNPAVTLGGSGDARTLAFSDDSQDSVQITVSVTSGGTVYTDTVTIVKVYDGASQAPDFTPPPTPTGLTVTAFLVDLGLTWDAPTFTTGGGYDSTIIYAAAVPDPAHEPTFANAVPVGSSSTNAFAYPTTTGTTVAFWIKHQSKDGVRSTLPDGGTNGVQGTTGLINGVNLAPLLIDASKLADGSVTATKLAAAAIDATKFANSIQPVTIITGTLPGTNVGNVIFRTNDGQLYKWNGTTYVNQVAAATISGQLTDAQLAGIAAAKLTGTLTTTQIGTGTIQTGNLAAGSITSAQIAADTITAANIAANAITASELAASAVTAGKIAANAVTAGTIAAAAVSAAQIAAGAITTAKLLVTGQGAALNDDPGCADASAWTSETTAAQFVTISDGVVGATAMRGGPATGVLSRIFPIDSTKTYRLRCWARNAGANGLFDLRVFFKDSNGNLVDFWGGLESITVPASFTQYSTTFGVGTSKAIPVAGKTAQIEIGFNFTGTTGFMEAQDIRVEEMVGTSLIVDGGITATKLAANSIAVGTAAIQNGAIVNAMIANAAIDNAQIVNATITGAKIASATITSANIASATITSANIANASIGSAQIADASITSAKIGSLQVASANIADLTIGTTKLGANAVTGSATATVGALGSVNGTVISFNYTSVGGTLLLFLSASAVAGSNTTATVTVTLDGVIVGTQTITAGVVAPASLNFDGTAIELPSAGTHSIAMSATATNFLGGSIILLELKK